MQQSRTKQVTKECCDGAVSAAVGGLCIAPIMRMFLGMTSSAGPLGSCERRHLLRRATATARFASCCGQAIAGHRGVE